MNAEGASEKASLRIFGVFTRAGMAWVRRLEVRRYGSSGFAPDFALGGELFGLLYLAGDVREGASW